MSSYGSSIVSRLTLAVAAFVAVVAVWSTTVSAEEVIDRIVAQVNDEIITLYELEQAVVPYLAERGESPAVLQQDYRRDEILEEVLDDQIDRILVEEEAEQLGLRVAEEQIQEWIAMTAQQQGMTEAQFRQAISQYGIEYDEYREIIRDNLLRMQLMQQQAGGGARVSDSEVDEAYRERFGESDGIEERLEVRHILLIPDQIEGGEDGAVERAAELRDKIESGEATFGQLAEEYSQGPGADDGGNIGTFGRGELAESFERAAFEQEVGVVSEPVHTEFGVHLIEIVDRQEREDTQVEQRKEQIRAQLQQQAMEEQMESYLETLRTRSFVDVRF